jgi:hypothetical protein
MSDDSPSAAELPPEPEVRHITPAPEDFENPPALSRYLWPIFWAALAAVLYLVAAHRGWMPAGEHEHGAPAGHEAPHEG